MSVRASIEVAGISALQAAYQAAHAGHLSLAQLKVMSAIENCRTAALGGHVEDCGNDGSTRAASPSVRRTISPHRSRKGSAKPLILPTCARKRYGAACPDAS